jgi:hypothetical protein
LEIKDNAISHRQPNQSSEIVCNHSEWLAFVTKAISLAGETMRYLEAPRLALADGTHDRVVQLSIAQVSADRDVFSRPKHRRVIAGNAMRPVADQIHCATGLVLVDLQAPAFMNFNPLRYLDLIEVCCEHKAHSTNFTLFTVVRKRCAKSIPIAVIEHRADPIPVEDGIDACWESEDQLE